MHHLSFLSLHALVVLASSISFSSAYPALDSSLSEPKTLRRGGGIDIPISRRTGLQRRANGAIGLGDGLDNLYTVPIQLGSTVTSVQIDTGSSDLWVTSDACTASSCGQLTQPAYPTSSFNSSGASFVINYADKTGASGPVGFDSASLAGVTIEGQAFGAVNLTTNRPGPSNIAGLLGLGFPAISQIQLSLLGDNTASSQPSTDAILQSTNKYGPLLSRVRLANALDEDVFAVSLQRGTVDIGENNGTLSIGKLPDGVDNSSLTWVPVRLYSQAEGGLKPPSFAPNEIYPYAWEVDLDSVYLDGKLLPNSTIPSTGGVSSTRNSALIDTGNSIIRGPRDVVTNILETVSPQYNPLSSSSFPDLPCTAAHSLAFKIGGKMFPVDPRDFISPIKPGETTTCTVGTLSQTNPPGLRNLHRWSLGDTFLKSNIVAFHYGNLTHPSVDPPRIGFLSKVPQNAAALLTQAVNEAKSAGSLESTVELAPTASAAAEAKAGITIDANGVFHTSSATSAGSTPSTSDSSSAKKNGADSLGLGWVSLDFLMVLAAVATMTTALLS